MKPTNLNSFSNKVLKSVIYITFPAILSSCTDAEMDHLFGPVPHSSPTTNYNSSSNVSEREYQNLQNQRTILAEQERRRVEEENRLRSLKNQMDAETYKRQAYEIERTKQAQIAENERLKRQADEIQRKIDQEKQAKRIKEMTERQDRINKLEADRIHLDAQERFLRNQELKAQEERNLEQARQNSLRTHAEEEARRNSQREAMRAQEERNLEEARQNSLRTHAEEEARRNAQREAMKALEERKLEEARQNSLRTHAEEEARRNAQREAMRAQEERNLEEARQNSLRTHAEEEARRNAQREAMRAQEERNLEEARQNSLRTHAEEEARRRNSQIHAPAPSLPSVAPSEGQIVKAGEIVMELKKKLGRTPSRGEIAEEVKSKMGVSSAVADSIIEELLD